MRCTPFASRAAANDPKTAVDAAARSATRTARTFGDVHGQHDRRHGRWFIAGGNILREFRPRIHHRVLHWDDWKLPEYRPAHALARDHRSDNHRRVDARGWCLQRRSAHRTRWCRRCRPRRAPVSGLEVDGVDGGLIRGLVINRFSGDGVILINASAWQVAGNYIGTDTAGKIAEANDIYGVQISLGSGNTIGGLATAVGTGLGNVISGNGNHGIHIDGDAANNVVEGNVVGLQADGSGLIANSNGGVGVALFNAGVGNVIGGTVSGAANVISGNAGDGIIIAGVSGTIVEGNLIGTDVGGTLDRGNAWRGVLILGSSGNTVGGSIAAARNILSGNHISGVLIQNAANFFGLTAGATDNLVEGNYIGTESSGTIALANAANGVDIEYDTSGDTTEVTSTSGNTIGGLTDSPGTGLGNIISGNSVHGVNIGSGAAANVIAGNLIGLGLTADPLGTTPLGNASQGIEVFGAGTGNVIGGTESGASNVVSGNGGQGIELAGVSGTLVAGNLIGTDPGGNSLGYGNGGDGVHVIGSSDNTIGGSVATTIGGSAASARNIISGNGVNGVELNFANDFFGVTGPSDDNYVQGNYIGTDKDGTAALPNFSDGFLINGGCTGNWIGTNGDGVADAGEGNVISGNHHHGVVIVNPGSDNNVVAGNMIGTDKTGSFSLGGQNFGMIINNRASGNRVGTNGDGVGDDLERNIISGNQGYGIQMVGDGTDDNLIAGNYIGTDASGSVPVPNGIQGIVIGQGASANLIGTNDADPFGDEGNVLSGNTLAGIAIVSNSDDNVVAGNIVGLDATATNPVPNGANGISVATGATGNRIGTNGDGVADAAEGNIVSANPFDGIKIVGADDNLVAGNFVGTNAAGALLGNGSIGVEIDGSATGNTIGGTGVSAGNIIGFNILAGVSISDATATGNLVVGNLIGTDSAGDNLGNGSGVSIIGASDNTIGGTVSGAGNTIAFNTGAGVTVDTGTGNTIRANAIFADNGEIVLQNAGNEGQSGPC